jgi:hypothetical protein
MGALGERCFPVTPDKGNGYSFRNIVYILLINLFDIVTNAGYAMLNDSIISK